MDKNYIDKINISGVNYDIKDSNSYTKEESNDIFVSKSQLDILNVEEDGFFIVDSSLNILMKNDNDGLDAVKISNHLINLINESANTL